MLRAIFLFHREFNGWNDIGYNFVLDRFGRIWEARAGGIDEPVAGAQAGGYNVVSSGVAVLGSYSGSRSRRRRAALCSGCWRGSSPSTARPQGRVTVRVDPAGASYSKYPANARVSLRRVSGHRDADSTDCPGDALYGELLRSARGCCASRATRSGRRSRCIPAVPRAGTSPQLEVSLADAREARRSPAPPWQLQARTVSRRGLEVVRTSTLAEGVTDAAGQFLAPRASRSAPRRPSGSAPSSAARYGVRRGRLAGRQGRAGGRRYSGISARAHAMSVPTSVSVSPRSGSVCTSSVGAARRSAQSRHSSSSASSIHASGRCPAKRSIASSFQCAFERPTAFEAQERDPGRETEEVRQVILGALFPAARPDELEMPCEVEQVSGRDGRKEVRYALDRVE